MSTIPAQSASTTPSAVAAAEGVEEIRPAGRSVIVIAFGWLVLASMFAIVCFASLIWGNPGGGRGGLLLVPIMVFLIVLVAASIVRNACRFQLSTTRVNAARGVFRRSSVEIRLDDVRNVVVGRSLVQRVLGLGTIRMTAAGIGPAVVWNHVDRPGELGDRVRSAIDGVRSGVRTSAPGGLHHICEAVDITRDARFDDCVCSGPTPCHWLGGGDRRGEECGGRGV